MKKVAVIHMILSIVVGLWMGWTAERYDALGQSLSFPVFFSLQPPMLLIYLVPQDLETTNKILFMFIVSFIGILCAVWIFCFRWLFVKLDNWLNHFPVLGRKVF